MLLIGSLAFKHQLPHLFKREAHDTDWIIAANRAQKFIEDQKLDIFRTGETCISTKYKGANIELFLATPENSWGKYLTYSEAWACTKIAAPEVLYSIKKAHIQFPQFSLRKFNKHIEDYSILHGVVKVDELAELTDSHRQATEERLGKFRTPSLMKTTEKFFGQSEDLVPSVFVHDDIHRIMAHKEQPMYEYMKVKPEEVFCSHKGWKGFTEQEKAWTVLEEAYVIALERKILPMLYLKGPYWSAEQAFKWAMKRICTNLCSGWFRQYACDYYNFIIQNYNEKYVNMFLTAVADKKLSQITKEVV